jgi:SpoU rRNA methylase family enzyme
VSEFYEASTVAKFEEAKWQDKVEGFNELKQAIESLQPDKTMVEATCKFVKSKMKDFKESNLNLMKETANVFLCMTQHCDDIPKRAVACYTPFLCEKIGDIKI